MGLDKHLFLMELQNDDCVNLTSFYKSVLEAWKVFTIGVDRLSAWPIIGADIKHFTDYRYRPF